MSGTKAAGWRGSRGLWLDAAREALVEGGLDAVRIQPLATRLKLSRTSFYWFFRDRQALLAALVDEWDAKNTGGLVSMADAYADSLPEAVLNVISAFLDDSIFDPKLDFAVRGWALQDPEVMARVNDADALRLAALRRMLERHGCGADDADVRARTIYLVQIGYISLQVRESLATRMMRIPGYVAIYSGAAPSHSDLARFHARHGFDPARSGGDADDCPTTTARLRRDRANPA